MKIFYRALFPVLLLTLSGCAQLVSKNYSPYRGGTVKYNTGWFMADTNRKKAIEEMQNYCSPGKVKILREDSKLEGTGGFITNGSTQGNSYSSSSTAVKEANMYIHFKCSSLKKTARR